MRLQALAPAKVNLFLHVGAPGADGYHDLCSLMVFADVGDRVGLELGGSGFAVTGPFAGSLAGETANLVVRARDLFIEAFGAGSEPIGLTLEKRLPIAAGLGGGSADAAATLRLMAEAWDLPAEDRTESGRLGALARTLGADVAACLASRPVLAEGRGDRLTATPPLPSIPAVLVNPLRPASTAAVYRAFDDAGVWGALAMAPSPVLGSSVEAVASWLGTMRNDLEAPAVRVQPAIAEVLDALRAAPEPLFARMSGSGATCFALCVDMASRGRLASRLAAEHPAWWVRACCFDSVR